MWDIYKVKIKEYIINYKKKINILFFFLDEFYLDFGIRRKINLYLKKTGYINFWSRYSKKVFNLLR